ncbi:DNA adenine methylase [Desulfitibacter alkalitolerans]|uniref:DNA adenine methylase n=1 Tax=Desulfitibacter alkalitolerans TaxID=264641 RepID=UPI000480023E|nr:DNA adenine methylase [Desulfitibacter alkalitolerans]
MQTLIKWPGGKSKELQYVKQLMPRDYNTYIEPFFGGGAVYFHIEPQKAIVNDLCKELILFYRYVKGDLDRGLFKLELYKYVECWESIHKYMESIFKELLKIYLDFRQGLSNPDQVAERVLGLFIANHVLLNSYFPVDFTVIPQNFTGQMVDNTIAKLKRIKALEEKQGYLSIEDVQKNIETAIRSGIYMHFRDLLNKNMWNKEISEAKKIANYYFIREFCYGSMFRFNSKGEFNIPYGGIAYNRKDFRKKVDQVFSEKSKAILGNTTIENMDFEKFFDKYALAHNDFVFLDPPYHSDFSEYQQNSFSMEDQKRLARCLLNLKARFVLIIKNTDFIMSLYKNQPGININSFDKTYLYNVRGRNNRKAEHLLIYNYTN